MRAHLDDIPPGRAVLVEGGYFTASPRGVDPGAALGPGPGPRTYLVRAPDPSRLEALAPPGSLSPGTAGLYGAVLSPATALRLHDELPGTVLMEVGLEPSEAARASFVLALEAFEYLRARGHERVTLGILIGDLQLRGCFRDRLTALLPESYLRLLREHDIPLDRVELLSEAHSRNQGTDRVLEPFERLYARAPHADQLYRERGCVLVTHPGADAVFLAADYVADHPRTFGAPWLVGLLDQGRPSCGLIVAGKLHQLERRGYQEVVSIYAEADDFNIHRKNLNGVVILGLLRPAAALRAAIFTLLDRGTSEPRFDGASVALGTVAAAGRRGGAGVLLEEAQRQDGTRGFALWEPGHPLRAGVADGSRAERLPPPEPAVGP